MLYHEDKARSDGFKIIVGVDEAGRGPLAGPVVASAVALQKKEFQTTIRDSKKMTAQQRERAFEEIQQNAFVGVGIISESIIDSINILQATYQAMNTAVRRLMDKLSLHKDPLNLPQDVCLLIDGNSFRTDLPYAHRTIIGGDNASLSIAAASIIAKVTRDRILDAYDKIFPQYGFKTHKGYPTQAHRLAIKTHGLSIIHRRTFRIF